MDDEFLEWLRRATERGWRDGCGEWQPGTRWRGGLDVDALERRTGAVLPADYRRFLAVLHATTPPQRQTRYVGDRPTIVEEPGFYDWERDGDAIANARAGVLEGLVFDVEASTLWPPTWGPRPDHPAARAARVTALVAAAPTLFPILGHRFVVGGTAGLVLSIVQSDIIVYGASLREYLLNELGGVINGKTRYQVSAYDLASIPFWGELIE